ncbi:MAG: TonB-dependent receptor plug domain-containing protein [Bacteroidales bacterium]
MRKGCSIIILTILCLSTYSQTSNVSTNEIVNDSVRLKEVTIVTNKKVISQTDKTIYIADNKLLTGVGITVDLLRKIPEISINEILGTASIKGKDKTLIIQNGINSSQSIDLRTINFRDIERIEVITSPSTAFDPQYDSVINIIMKPKMQGGVSLSFEETLRLDLEGNDTYVGITAGNEKIRFKLGYDNYYRATPYDIDQTREERLSEKKYIMDGNASKPYENTNSVDLNLDYHISQQDFLNITTRSRIINSSKKIRYESYILEDGKEDENIAFDTRFATDYFIGNYTAFYRHKIKDKAGDHISINTNFTYTDGKDRTESLYEQGSSFVTQEKAKKYAGNLRLEYNTILNEYLKLNVGTRGYFQNFNGDVENSNDYNNLNNTVITAYTDWTISLNPLQFTIGLKGEYNNVRFKNREYGENTQFAFQPNAMILYRLNSQNNLKLEFRRPSSYPSAWMYAPYTIIIDEKSTSVGNPNLKLTQYNILELTHTYRKGGVMINTTPYYRNSYNHVVQTIDYDQDLNSVISLNNGGRIQAAGVYINGGINLLGGGISIDPDIRLSYESINYKGESRSNFYTKLGGTFMLAFPYGLACGTYGAWSSKRLTIVGHREPNFSLDIFAMKRFEKPDIALFIGYQSILLSADITQSNNGIYSQRDYYKAQTKGFLFRFNYYFQSGKNRKMENIKTDFDNDKK